MPISREMLGTFLCVADTLSVSAAAERLGVGKSIVSKRVAQLESLLGATLFARSTRRVVLTPAGEVYAVHARRALDALSEGEEEVRALRVALSGRVRLTAPVSWGQRVLSKQLPGFLKIHPGIEIDLHLADRITDIAFERYDLALRWSTSAPPPELVSMPIARVDWALVATPGYLADRGEPTDPDALRLHDCLAYWSGALDAAWTLVRGAQAAQVQAPSRYHVDNPEAVLDAALAGLGIAQVPTYLCRHELDQGVLRQILPDWTPCTRFGTFITALTTPERLRVARNRSLLAYLQARLDADRRQAEHEAGEGRI
jgi:DNA-binding transcriptional LysR family regulator